VPARHRFVNALATALLVALALRPVAHAEPRVTLVSADKAQVTGALHPTAKRPRLVHLWASWCMPCRAELPELAAFWRQLGDRPLDLVMVAIDDSDAAAADVRLLTGAGGVPGQTLRAPAAAAFPAIRGIDADWDGSIPTTYVIDGDGHVVLAQRGETEAAELRTTIDRVTSTGKAKAQKRRSK
jgi:thiol-disulfide isomerase/thioredoxin